MRKRQRLGALCDHGCGSYGWHDRSVEIERKLVRDIALALARELDLVRFDLQVGLALQAEALNGEVEDILRWQERQMRQTKAQQILKKHTFSASLLLLR